MVKFQQNPRLFSDSRDFIPKEGRSDLSTEQIRIAPASQDLRAESQGDAMRNPTDYLKIFIFMDIFSCIFVRADV
jgi:hypothetical protein